MSTEYSIRRILVVPAALQAELNAAATTLDPTGGDATFTVGLSSTGLAPATHYVCNAALRLATWEFVEQVLAPQYEAAQIFDGNEQTIDQVLTGLGLRFVGSEE